MTDVVRNFNDKRYQTSFDSYLVEDRVSFAFVCPSEYEETTK